MTSCCASHWLHTGKGEPSARQWHKRRALGKRALLRHQDERLRRRSQCASVLAPMADSSSGSVSSSRAHSWLRCHALSPALPCCCARGGSSALAPLPAPAAAQHWRCCVRAHRRSSRRRRSRTASRQQPPAAKQ